MTRLRVGVLLIILSWLPFAQVLLWIAHDSQHLTSQQASTAWRLAIWSVQILIGLIGVWLAGKLAVASIRRNGWKRAPAELWHLLRSGSS